MPNSWPRAPGACWSADSAHERFRHHPAGSCLLPPGRFPGHTSAPDGRGWRRWSGHGSRLELRRTEPGEVPALHATAASWYAEHGYPVGAIRHAQVGQDWRRAGRLLSDHWVSLVLDGQAATAHELLTGFPTSVVAADAELTALMAADKLHRGSLQAAERYLAHATRVPGLVPADRRGHVQVMLAILRLSFARQRGDLPTVAGEAERLLAPAEAADAAQPGLGEDLHALALISLGIAELWSLQFEEADRHLGQGIALERRIGRPYLEITGLAHLAQLERLRSLPLGAQRPCHSGSVFPAGSDRP